MGKLAFLFIIFTALNSYANDANTICRNAGSVVLVLHKDVNGTVSENADGNWSVNVPYDILSGGEPNPAGRDTVTGITSCNTISVKSAPDGSSYNGGAATCASECNTYCANGFANNTAMSNGRVIRDALIDAVW